MVEVVLIHLLAWHRPRVALAPVQAAAEVARVVLLAQQAYVQSCVLYLLIVTLPHT